SEAFRLRIVKGFGMLNHHYLDSQLIDPSGGRLLPDVPLGDGVRLRALLGSDGELIEIVQNGAKLSVGEATCDLSESASRDLRNLGGPLLAVRPDNLVAYSGASREKAEAMLARWKPLANSPPAPGGVGGGRTD